MSQSTIKKNLLEDDQQILSKIIVGCSINGWLQTNKKQPQKLINNRRKFQIRKKSITKPLFEENQTNAKIQLKRRRAELMKTPLKVFKTKQTSQSTKESNNINSSYSCPYSSKQMKNPNSMEIPLIHVNEFKPETVQVPQLKKSNFEVQNKILPSSMSSLRKQSLNQLKNIQRIDCLLKEKKIDHSLDILKEIAQQHKYQGLNFIRRKHSVHIRK